MSCEMIESIPSFYRKKNEGLGVASDFQRLCRARFIAKKSVEVNLDDNEFRILLSRMVQLSEPQDGIESLDGKTMTFDAFISLSRSDDIHVIFRKQIFTPSKFLLFPRTIYGTVYADCVFSCAAEMREYRRIRFDLAQLDSEDTGYLTEPQVSKCISQFMQDVHEDQKSVFVAVSARKFLFFLGESDRIPIKLFMASSILSEFKQRHVNDPSNWFSTENIYHLYDTFLTLDEDRDTLLSAEEFAKFRLDMSSLPRVSHLIVSRVLGRKVTRSANNPSGMLEFRHFLDFVLAFQNKKTLASLKYFWSLFDINDVGYITGPDVIELLVDMFDTLTEETLHAYAGGSIDPKDVKDEIFDMVNSGTSDIITFDNLVKSNIGDTIVTMLTDPSGFLLYEQREQLLYNQQREQEFDGQYEQQQYEQAEYQDASAAIFNGGINPDEADQSDFV